MSCFFRFLPFSLAILCSISINSFSDDIIETLGNELNNIKERIAFVDQEITGKLIARNDIITNAKEIIFKELNKENEKVKSLIKIENRNKEDFFNVVPQKTFNEVSNLINKQYEDNWKLHEGEYKAKILEEFPLLKPGMRTSIKTKRGVFEGYLRKIHPSCIQINNKTIYFIDLEDDEIARLDKTRYQAFVDKELLKAKRDMKRTRNN